MGPGILRLPHWDGLKGFLLFGVPGRLILRGRRPAASSSLRRFSQSLVCWSLRTWFNTCAVLVCSWVHLSLVLASSFSFCIISRDRERLSLSCRTTSSLSASSLGC